jgi:hypothetical protein
MNTNFKPGVAGATLTCVLGGATVCAPNVYACAKQALNNACPDSTADTDCADIVANCSNDGGAAATAAECHALIDGLNATGRMAVVMCSQSAAAPCDGAAGIYACIEGLIP